MSQLYLVGVDCSACGDRALEYATQKARNDGSKILVAHVIEWSQFSFNTAEENAIRHKRREAEISRAQSEVIDPIVNELRGQGIEAEGVVRHGHIARTLKSLADEHNVNTIVIGRQGASNMVAQLFGSVSGTLIQIADQPVTVVP